MSLNRLLYAVPAVPAAGAALVAAQVLMAAHRPDLPSLSNQNPSGKLGDPALPPLRIVALGDSSLTSPGVTDLDNTWVRTLARSQTDRYHVELISLGVGGSKARDVIEGQLDEAVRLEPDLAIVSVGANDALRGVPVQRYRAEIIEIITRLEAVADAILLFGVGDLGVIPRLPQTLRPYVTHRSSRFDMVCRDIAVSSERVVKAYTRGRMSTAFQDDESLFADDLFHAGDTGHRVFAEEAMPAMRAAVAILERERTSREHSVGRGLDHDVA